MGPKRGKDSKGMSRGKASNLKKTRKERLGKTRTQNEGLWICFLREWLSTPVFLPGQSLWTEGPGGLQSMGSQTVRHNWATK